MTDDAKPDAPDLEDDLVLITPPSYPTAEEFAALSPEQQDALFGIGAAEAVRRGRALIGLASSPPPR